MADTDTKNNKITSSCDLVYTFSNITSLYAKMFLVLRLQIHRNLFLWQYFIENGLRRYQFCFYAMLFCPAKPVSRVQYNIIINLSISCFIILFCTLKLSLIFRIVNLLYSAVHSLPWLMLVYKVVVIKEKIVVMSCS